MYAAECAGRPPKQNEASGRRGLSVGARSGNIRCRTASPWLASGVSRASEVSCGAEMREAGKRAQAALCQPRRSPLLAIAAGFGSASALDRRPVDLPSGRLPYATGSGVYQQERSGRPSWDFPRSSFLFQGVTRLSGRFGAPSLITVTRGYTPSRAATSGPPVFAWHLGGGFRVELKVVLREGENVLQVPDRQPLPSSRRLGRVRR